MIHIDNEKNWKVAQQVGNRDEPLENSLESGLNKRSSSHEASDSEPHASDLESLQTLK